MKLDAIKKKMIAYTDLLGGKMDQSLIEAASTKEELEQIIADHDTFISEMANDAQIALGRFKEKLKLTKYHR